jgi:hypothetical protein
MRKLIPALVGVVCAMSVAASLPSASAASIAAPSKVTAQSSGIVNFVPSAGLACGRSTVGSERYYRHCTNDGSAIQVRARFIVWNNKIACVGPNQAVRIRLFNSYSLDWNGKTCTNPGSVWNE